MTTGRINQVAVVLEVRPGEVLRSPGTLVPQTYLDGSAVIPQPDIRQLCPSSNITTLCEARQLFTRRAKPTLTLYSVADCVANLSLSVRQSRCLKAPCTLRRQLPGCPQCSGGREKRQACWTSRSIPSAPWKSSERKRETERASIEAVASRETRRLDQRLLESRQVYQLPASQLVSQP